MDFEVLKQEFIELKMEELNYIYEVLKNSETKIYNEIEKLGIYRKLKKYELKSLEMFEKMWDFIPNFEYEDIFVEIDLEEDFKKLLEIKLDYIEKFLINFNINEETYKYELSYQRLMNRIHSGKTRVENDVDSNFKSILNGQDLSDKDILVTDSFYEEYDDGDYVYDKKKYRPILYGDEYSVLIKKAYEFEKNKIIFNTGKYTDFSDVQRIFRKELMNEENKTVNDCVIKTRERLEKLNYSNSPENQEKKLLNKINKLYKKVKGNLISEELLYDGKFIDIVKEIYKLPNNKIVEKEKTIKNGGKDSVVIIPIVEGKKCFDRRFILTVQNRIKDKLIMEFPSGYIENGETPIKAAKRELEEETGYIPQNMILIDQVYTSLGTDSSKTYIVLAEYCINKGKKNERGTEYVKYDLFNDLELDYFINNNIMGGSINKLAYYKFKYTNRADLEQKDKYPLYEGYYEYIKYLKP